MLKVDQLYEYTRFGIYRYLQIITLRTGDLLGTRREQKQNQKTGGTKLYLRNKTKRKKTYPRSENLSTRNHHKGSGSVDETESKCFRAG